MCQLFAAAALLLFGGVADTGEIATLIGQLGSPDFRARESASKQLSAIGAPALPALQTAATGTDAEVSRRAAALVDAISKRVDNDRTLAPKLVELSAENVPLSEVLARLGKQSGYKLGLNVIDPGLSRKTVTVKTDGRVPFLSAVERVCDAANLGVTGTPDAQQLARELALQRLADLDARRAAGAAGRRRFPATPFPAHFAPGTLVLSPRAGSRNPSCVRGAVRVEAVPYPAAARAAVPFGTVPVLLHVTTEPRLHWVRVESVRVTTAVDDAGQSLAAAPHADAVTMPTQIARVRGGAIVVNGRGGVILGTVQPPTDWTALNRPTQAVARLKASENPSKRLREFAGMIRGEVRSGPEEIATLTGLGDKPAETSSHGVSLKAGAVQKLNGGYAMVLTMSYDPAVVQPAHGGNGVLTETAVMQNGIRVLVQRQAGAGAVNGFNVARPNGLSLTDADGEPFHLRSTRQSVVVSPGGVVTYQMTLLARPVEAGQGEPAKLSFHGTRTKHVEVPFKLTDVPVAPGSGPTAAEPTPLPARR